MRKAKFLCVLLVLGFVGCGCSSPAGVGGGLVLGAFGVKTLEGFKADLQQREQEAIDRYNEGVASGMQAENLEQIEKEIEFNRKLQAGSDVGKEFLGVDWSDPKETSGVVAVATEFILLLLFGKKFKQTSSKYKAHKVGTSEFMKDHEPELANELYKNIGIARGTVKTG